MLKSLRVCYVCHLLSLYHCHPLTCSEFLGTHNELKDKKASSISSRQFSLEEEHAKIMKSLDIDNYTLSRVPRPEEGLPAAGAGTAGVGATTTAASAATTVSVFSRGDDNGNEGTKKGGRAI